MPLSLYRRHRRECEAKALHPEDSRTYEADEKRKGYQGRCRCLIHVGGTLNGRRIRQSTNTTDWEPARKVADALQAGSTIATPSPEPVTPPARVTIADACAAFMTNRESAQIAPATLRKYRTFTKQLMAYADSRGYVMIDQWLAGDVDLFYASLKLGPRTKGKRLGILRAFFRFCAHRKWIPETPVSPTSRLLSARAKPPTRCRSAKKRLSASCKPATIRHARSRSTTAAPARSTAPTRTIRVKANGPARTSRT
jgi:hypothetical protein